VRVKTALLIGSVPCSTHQVLLRDIRILDLESSQVAFAKQLGITKQMLCDIERGRRLLSVRAAMNLAELLGYSARVFAFYAIRDNARAQMRKAGLDGVMHFDLAI
jgi:transcriptional regulator with XRE-family HTH domain